MNSVLNCVVMWTFEYVWKNDETKIVERNIAWIWR